ncbi:hypothetical protein HS962_06075 [Pantoea sp. BIGb0393]|uniref:Uncharacterized protein n=1 Tax=Pantoea nemavictus TaxID=2726955 RepID=A0ABU8PPX1_9GAMM|nr:hypothetical protein [Pantoea nemavictus]MBA0035797.1 hypothetical protein [Pantoea nemavictus]
MQPVAVVEVEVIAAAGGDGVEVDVFLTSGVPFSSRAPECTCTLENSYGTSTYFLKGFGMAALRFDTRQKIEKIIEPEQLTSGWRLKSNSLTYK